MDPRAALRRYGDVVLGVGLAAVAVTEVLAWADSRLPLSVAWAVLMTLPLALRRRTPLVSFAAVMVGLHLLSAEQPGFDNDSMSLVVAYFIALYSLGRHARGAEAWLGGVGLVVVMGAFAQGEGGLQAADPGDVAFLLAFVGAPWAAGLTVRLRREGETAMHAENERLRVEREQAATRAVAEERARIARELHDVVSHAISVTVLQARGARRVLATDPEAARAALDAIEHTNAAALGDMRRLLAVLRDTEPVSAAAAPDAGDSAGDDRAPQPSLASLDRLVAGVRESGVPVQVEVVGTPEAPPSGELPPGVDLSAYRIVQEALTNVLKHSAEATATVRLSYEASALVVEVTDDGIPGPLEHSVDRGGGHGLVGIRERVSVIGGDVEMGPAPGGGFAVRARLPYALELS